MTDRRTVLLAAVLPALALVAAGRSPLLLPFVAVGALLPDLDAVDEASHRSWALHTFLAPALAYQALARLGVLTALAEAAIHFVTVGLAVHFVYDYVYPKGMDHAGAVWPVRPEPGDYWGLVFLGVSWAVQWLFYLAPAFVPWLFGVR